MMTRGSRSNSVGVPDADLADPLERAAIGDDEQVVRRVAVRVGPERSTPSMKSYSGGTGSVQTGSAVPTHRLDETDDAERGPERVGIGVLVADRQHAPRAAEPVDDDVRDGVEVRRRDRRSSERLRASWRRSGDAGRRPSTRGRDGGGRVGGHADGGSSPRSPS